MTSAKRVDKVADACQKLYGDGDGDGKSKDLLRSFLESQVPKSDAKEIEQELKKTLLLKKLKGSKKREKKERPIKKPKKLTARQKRDLGLNRLPKKGLKYQDFRPMYALWLEYMRSLLDFSKWKGSNCDDNIQMRLCRADYHGALVKVTRAPCPGHVGCEGLVVMETRNAFQILSRDDVLRIIPKKGASFTFRVDQHIFTVGGSYMLMRPAERAVKKWKTRGPLDL